MGQGDGSHGSVLGNIPGDLVNKHGKVYHILQTRTSIYLVLLKE